MQKFKPLRRQLGIEDADTGEVAARSVQALYQADLDRIRADQKYDWNDSGGSLRSERRYSREWSGDHGYLAAHQIGGQRWQAIIVTFCPTVGDRNVSAFDVAALSQALAERPQICRIQFDRRAAKIANHRNRGLLRPCRHRPRRGRAAEEGDELAPS